MSEPTKEPIEIENASIEELTAHLVSRIDWHWSSPIHRELAQRLEKSGHLTPSLHGYSGRATRDLIVRG